MLEKADIFGAVSGTGFFGAADVLDTNQAEGMVRVRPTQSDRRVAVWARSAVSFDQLADAETVLAAGADPEHMYVIGVLSRSAAASADPQRLTAAHGAYAELAGSALAETLRVFSHRGELLFEYDPVGSKTRLNVPAGDLEIAADAGSIGFVAAHDVRFHAQSIEVTGQNGIRLAIGRAIGKMLSAVSLRPGGVEMSAPDVAVTAKHGRVHVEKARCTGKRCDILFGHFRLAADKLETVAETVIDKAKNVYRTVKGLFQTKSGRVRTVVESTFHLKAENAHLKTSEDFKVKGEKIHLG